MFNLGIMQILLFSANLIQRLRNSYELGVMSFFVMLDTKFKTPKNYFLEALPVLLALRVA